MLTRFESDTFSASGWRMTSAEAELVARSLIARWAARNLDGVAVRGVLEELRGKD